MRQFPQSTAALIPFTRPRPRCYARRRLASFAGHLTYLMLFAHDETDSQILISDDGDAVGAVWLAKPLLVIDRSRGRFLVVTISQKTASQNRLSTPLIDRSRFTPEERADLEEALATASGARKRLSGREEPLPFPGGMHSHDQAPQSR